MIADLPAVAYAAPFVETQIDRRRRDRGSSTRLAIGMVIILSDGSECVIAGFDKQGNPLCHPPE